jgi:hypothetical protein
VSTEALKLSYFASVHSIISYGIIFCGSATNVHKVFIMQKRIVRIIKESCRKMFKLMGIMTLYSRYIYSILLFIINNKTCFFTNGEIHEYKTRVYKDIHMPTVNLTKYKKGLYITHIKVFNCLPQSIKMLVNEEKSVKSALKRFLYHHSFYSMNEYYCGNLPQCKPTTPAGTKK